MRCWAWSFVGWFSRGKNGSTLATVVTVVVVGSLVGSMAFACRFATSVYESRATSKEPIQKPSQIANDIDFVPFWVRLGSQLFAGTKFSGWQWSTRQKPARSSMAVDAAWPLRLILRCDRFFFLAPRDSWKACILKIYTGQYLTGKNSIEIQVFLDFSEVYFCMIFFGVRTEHRVYFTSSNSAIKGYLWEFKGLSAHFLRLVNTFWAKCMAILPPSGKAFSLWERSIWKRPKNWIID